MWNSVRFINLVVCNDIILLLLRYNLSTLYSILDIYIAYFYIYCVHNHFLDYIMWIYWKIMINITDILHPDSFMSPR